jgi:hypothetical protein
MQINTKTLTERSVIDILADEVQRAELIKLVEAEQGTNLPLTNLYEKVAEQCEASPQQLRETVRNLITLYGNKNKWLIEPFIFHFNIPDDVLYDLYERGIFIIALAHRKGPQELLELLASDYQISEAITTLALNYYLPDQAQPGKFLEFVAKYRNDQMLRRNLLKSPKLSDDMRLAVLAIYDDIQDVQ